jgi:hypothetical protein
MRRARSKLMMVVAFAAALSAGKSSRAAAQQDETPDLRMLLNLDLFGRSQEQPGGANPHGSSAPSMLEQIQTLRAMGYLSGANATAATATDPPPTGSGGNVTATPEPSYDKGVPQL